MEPIDIDDEAGHDRELSAATDENALRAALYHLAAMGNPHQPAARRIRRRVEGRAGMKAASS
jgi:hypothetical protein